MDYINDFNDCELFDNDSMDVFINYKYAFFNRPLRDSPSEIAINPYIDINLCIKYNNKFNEFIKKPIEERIAEIIKSDQLYNDATFSSHLEHILDDMLFSRMNHHAKSISCHKYLNYTILQDSIKNDLTEQETLLLFHLLDIFYSGNSFLSERSVLYPFIIDRSVFANRFLYAEDMVLRYICDALDFLIDDDEKHTDYSLCARVILNGLFEWWKIEQKTLNGIRVDLKSNSVQFIDDAPDSSCH